MKCCICGLELDPERAFDAWPVSENEDDVCCKNCFDTFCGKVQVIYNFIDTLRVLDSDELQIVKEKTEDELSQMQESILNACWSLNSHNKNKE